MKETSTHKNETAAPLNRKAKIRNPWIRFILFLVFWLFGAALFYALLVLPFYPDFASTDPFRLSTDPDYLFLLLTNAAAACGTFLAYWLMKRNIENQWSTHHIRFDFFPFMRGCLVGLIIMVTVLLIYILTGLAYLHFNNLSNLLSLIMLFVLVAMAEELVFRAYLLDMLVERLVPWKAIVWSSVIFSLFHLGNDHFGIIGFVNIFLSGVLLAYLYLEHRNLSMPIGLHFAWNLLQAMFGFSVSGQPFGNVFTLKFYSDTTFLTGGGFGMEGSALLTPITLLAIAYVYRRKHIMHSPVRNENAVL